VPVFASKNIRTDCKNIVLHAAKMAVLRYKIEKIFQGRGHSPSPDLFHGGEGVTRVPAG